MRSSSPPAISLNARASDATSSPPVSAARTPVAGRRRARARPPAAIAGAAARAGRSAARRSAVPATSRPMAIAPSVGTELAHGERERRRLDRHGDHRHWRAVHHDGGELQCRARATRPARVRPPPRRPGRDLRGGRTASFVSGLRTTVGRRPSGRSARTPARDRDRHRGGGIRPGGGPNRSGSPSAAMRRPMRGPCRALGGGGTRRLTDGAARPSSPRQTRGSCVCSASFRCASISSAGFSVSAVARSAAIVCANSAGDRPGRNSAVRPVSQRNTSPCTASSPRAARRTPARCASRGCDTRRFRACFELNDLGSTNLYPCPTRSGSASVPRCRPRSSDAAA